MIRESRLLRLTIEDINKQRLAAGATATNTTYNTRTAEANATVQQGTAGGSDANALNNAANLKQQQAFLNEAQAVGDNAAGGFATQYNAPSLAGQQAGQIGTAQVAGNGEIQQSAIDRLRAA